MSWVRFEDLRPGDMIGEYRTSSPYSHVFCFFSAGEARDFDNDTSLELAGFALVLSASQGRKTSPALVSILTSELTIWTGSGAPDDRCVLYKRKKITAKKQPSDSQVKHPVG